MINQYQEMREMRKSVDGRISYYTRKVAEKGSIHPAKKQPAAYKYRSKRLMLYKKLLHELIENME